MKAKPLFFLHLPRTGGTTVDDILRQNFSNDKILKIYTKDDYIANRYITQEKLDTIEYITGHLLLQEYNPPKIYNQPVKVLTFLREPVSRLISEYIFYKNWSKQHLYNYLNDNKISFKEYLLSSDNILKYRGKNFMTRCISGQSFNYNQTSYRALAIAKRNLEKNFFFFGLTDRFNESILMLAAKLNFKKILYEQRNKLNQKLKNEITQADRDLAAELNQADTSLFNFASSLFQAQIEDLAGDFKTSLSQFNLLNAKYQKLAQINSNAKPEDLIYLPK